ncbi:ribonuclease H-like domain-containing protein, partial [Mycena galopus ATCC 62051]
YLGTEQNHSSVEAEMWGIILGLKIAQTFPSLTQVTILTDCQAAICQFLSANSKYGPLVERFHTEVRNMGNVRCILLVWVPGHEGVEMNELADTDAKAAA